MRARPAPTPGLGRLHARPLESLHLSPGGVRPRGILIPSREDAIATDPCPDSPTPDAGDRALPGSWYYAIESGTVGPMRAEELLRREALGILTPLTLVHSSDADGWAPLRELRPTLAKEAQPAAQAPPQVPPGPAGAGPSPGASAPPGAAPPSSWAEDLGCMAAVFLGMLGLLFVLLLVVGLLTGGTGTRPGPAPARFTFCQGVDAAGGPIAPSTIFPPGRIGVVVGDLPAGHTMLEIDLFQIDEATQSEQFIRRLSLPIANQGTTCHGELPLAVKGVYRIRAELPGGQRVGEETLRVN